MHATCAFNAHDLNTSTRLGYTHSPHPHIASRSKLWYLWFCSIHGTRA